MAANKEVVTIRQGEAKRLVFTLKRGGSVFDVSAGSFSFAVKKTYTDDSYSIIKKDVDFDKSLGAGGQVSVLLESADTIALTPGKYKAQLKSKLAADDVDVSDEIIFTIEATAFHVETTTTTSTTTT